MLQLGNLLRSGLRTFLPIAGVLIALYLLVNEMKGIEFGQLYIDYAKLSLSVLILVGIFFFDALGWALIVRSQRVNATLVDSCLIWLTSSVSRYVPGVIWGYLSRASFLSDSGASKLTIVRCFLVESLLLALAGILVGANVIWFESVQASLHIYELEEIINIKLLALGLAVIIALYVVYRLKRNALVTIWAELNNLLIRKYWLIAYYIGFWFLFSLVFGGFATSIYEFSINQQLFIGFSFCISFALAFMLIIFPSGLGAREVIFFYLLKTQIPIDQALILVAISRLWLMCGELVSAALALAIKSGIFDKRLFRR